MRIEAFKGETARNFDNCAKEAGKNESRYVETTHNFTKNQIERNTLGENL